LVGLLATGWPRLSLLQQRKGILARLAHNPTGDSHNAKKQA